MVGGFGFGLGLVRKQLGVLAIGNGVMSANQTYLNTSVAYLPKESARLHSLFRASYSIIEEGTMSFTGLGMQ